MKNLVNTLSKDFQNIDFVSGEQFYWSPSTNQIYYSNKIDSSPEVGAWSLLHEVGHALLEHKNYHSDFELLLLESAAWQKACDIANNYNIVIDPSHIQDCLDTYRDWLHKRSTCPMCSVKNFQSSPTEYKCANCNATWNVTIGKFCRPYRKNSDKIISNSSLN